jgi:Helicase subunit of the DNA excision repair complex
LIDPEVEIRPAKTQVEDLYQNVKKLLILNTEY